MKDRENSKIHIPRAGPFPPTAKPWPWVIQTSLFTSGTSQPPSLQASSPAFPSTAGFPGHLVFSPDGKTLAVSGDKHCALCLLDIATDKRLLAQKLSHEYDVRALSFSPDGKILATGGPDGLVLLWNALTGEPFHDLKWPESWIYTVAFSPDGRTFASGSQGSEVRVWDRQRQTALETAMAGA